MDGTLNSLVECERLALSTNCIDRIVALGGMAKLKILSLGRNNLKKIDNLDANAGTLEELWLSFYNPHLKSRWARWFDQFNHFVHWQQPDQALG